MAAAPAKMAAKKPSALDVGAARQAEATQPPSRGASPQPSPPPADAQSVRPAEPRSPASPAASVQNCAVSGCARSRVAGFKGYCREHAAEFLAHRVASPAPSVAASAPRASRPAAPSPQPQPPLPPGVRACAVAGCARPRAASFRVYCAEHGKQQREHTAATRIQSAFRALLARRSYNSLLTEQILEEERKREAEDAKREAEVDALLSRLEATERRRRDTLVSTADRFRFDSFARVLQFAIRWRRRAREAAARAKAEAAGSAAGSGGSASSPRSPGRRERLELSARRALATSGMEGKASEVKGPAETAGARAAAAAGGEAAAGGARDSSGSGLVVESLSSTSSSAASEQRFSFRLPPTRSLRRDSGSSRLSRGSARASSSNEDLFRLAQREIARANAAAPIAPEPQRPAPPAPPPQQQQQQQQQQQPPQPAPAPKPLSTLPRPAVLAPGRASPDPAHEPRGHVSAWAADGLPTRTQARTPAQAPAAASPRPVSPRVDAARPPAAAAASAAAPRPVSPRAPLAAASASPSQRPQQPPPPPPLRKQGSVSSTTSSQAAGAQRGSRASRGRAGVVRGGGRGAAQVKTAWDTSSK